MVKKQLMFICMQVQKWVQKIYGKYGKYSFQQSFVTCVLTIIHVFRLM